MNRKIVLGLVLLSGVLDGRAMPVVPEKVPCAVRDRQAPAAPDQVHLTGWVGQRVLGNEANRLAQLDPERLLEGYRHRPGRQDWDGEHVGKWLHAATLAWVNTGDAALRAKLDTIAAELGRCQLDDGYLGTYEPEKRWTSWDVWSHKYNLIGLITYVRHTGNLAPVATCRRMADLLCATFGDGPGHRDIITAGEHVGLAPTSVLEPMVLLYRLTGEQRYLDFCQYLVRAWEQPNGPKLLYTLLREKRVDRVGNGKAYEMLSCLNGLAELYRTTGEPTHLQACLNAWADIEAHRLYLTGAASYRELFRADHDLPNTNNVGETCVTVTWLQLNAQLLRLTGEARFADELERVVLNQLLGAQSPDCTAWGYYVQLQGRKPYSTSLTGHCCLSSGPRGIALIPTFALATDRAGIVVNLYDAGTAALPLPDGSVVKVVIATGFPSDGIVRIKLSPATSQEFDLRLRLPAWSTPNTVAVNGTVVPATSAPGGYAVVRRMWKAGDEVELRLQLQSRIVRGDHTNAGKIAFCRGPLVLAADDAFLPTEAMNLAAVFVPDAGLDQFDFRNEPATSGLGAGGSAQVFRINAKVRQTGADGVATVPCRIGLVPFAEAGAAASRYKVWLPLAAPPEPNVLLEGVGSASVPAAEVDDARLINDGDGNTAASLSTRDRSRRVWFGVQLPRPARIQRVTFFHGGSWGHGGWFDASHGRPEVQVQRERDGDWIGVGELSDYPATTALDGASIQRAQAWDLSATAADAARLNRQQTFTCSLPHAETAIGIRVVGDPSQGNEPGSYTVKCAELAAWTE